MDLLKKSAEVYRQYVNCNCIFTLDCNLSIMVEFRDVYFHHLVGLQYLKDIVQVDRSLPNNSASIYIERFLKEK